MIILVISIVFIWYVLNKPQVPFPWSNTISNLMYLIYMAIMIGCFYTKGKK